MSKEKIYLVSFMNTNKYIVPVKASSKKEAADLALDFHISDDAIFPDDWHQRYWHDYDTKSDKICAVETKKEYIEWQKKNGEARFITYAEMNHSFDPYHSFDTKGYIDDGSHGEEIVFISGKLWEEKFNRDFYEEQEKE